MALDRADRQHGSGPISSGLPAQSDRIRKIAGSASHRTAAAAGGAVRYGPPFVSLRPTTTSSFCSLAIRSFLGRRDGTWSRPVIPTAGHPHRRDIAERPERRDQEMIAVAAPVARQLPGRAVNLGMVLTRSPTSSRAHAEDVRASRAQGIRMRVPQVKGSSFNGSNRNGDPMSGPGSLTPFSMSKARPVPEEGPLQPFRLQRARLPAVLAAAASGRPVGDVLRAVFDQ